MQIGCKNPADVVLPADKLMYRLTSTNAESRWYLLFRGKLDLITGYW